MTNDFFQIIGEDKPTLVDFFATWCGPCKMQAPILEQVKEAVGDKANILKVDVDANSELAGRYNVRSIPTLMIFRKGEAVWTGVGLHQAADLQARLEEAAK